jgi:hypothetical protein
MPWRRPPIANGRSARTSTISGPHTTIQVGDFPLTKPVLEGGKFEFGTFGEKKEQVAVAAYAIQTALSRHLLVNDTLGALERVISNYGQSLALVEEQLAYAVLLQNSGDGPSLLEGSAAMFTTGRTNKAAAATGITEAGVSAMRAAVSEVQVDRRQSAGAGASDQAAGLAG